MTDTERLIKLKTLEAEIAHLQDLRPTLVAIVHDAEKVVKRNDDRQDAKRREMIALLKEAAQ